MIVSVAIMNLIIATLVDQATARRKDDADFKMKKILRLRPQMQRAFQIVDVNQDHSLSRHELAKCVHELPEVLRVCGAEVWYG